MAASSVRETVRWRLSWRLIGVLPSHAVFEPSASGDRHGQLREVRGDGVDGSQRCAASGACTPGVAYGAECRLIGLGSGATFVFALPERSVVDKADNARDSNALHDVQNRPDQDYRDGATS